MAEIVAETQSSKGTASAEKEPKIGTEAEQPSPPFITVEGVPNFRGLGGYASHLQGSAERANGLSQKPRIIRPGYLFRCAQLSRITPAGVSALTSTLNIHTVYDLRSFKELRLMEARYPDQALEVPGVTRHHIPIYKDEDYSPISMAKKYEVTSESSSDGKGYLKAYEDIARQAAETSSYRKIMLHLLERPDEPVAVHCTVGKDRTGVFAALILKLCGVNNEEIMWDYALTTGGLGSWREHLIKRLMDGAGNEFRNAGEKADDKKPPTRAEAEKIIGSHAEHMQGFLDDIVDKKFGGVRKYFKDFCGFKDEELDAIVSNLLVEGDAYVPPEAYQQT